jgi:hypothetical protein
LPVFEKREHGGEVGAGSRVMEGESVLAMAERERRGLDPAKRVAEGSRLRGDFLLLHAFFCYLLHTCCNSGDVFFSSKPLDS